MLSNVRRTSLNAADCTRTAYKCSKSRLEYIFFSLSSATPSWTVLRDRRAGMLSRSEKDVKKRHNGQMANSTKKGGKNSQKGDNQSTHTQMKKILSILQDRHAHPVCQQYFAQRTRADAALHTEFWKEVRCRCMLLSAWPVSKRGT